MSARILTGLAALLLTLSTLPAQAGTSRLIRLQAPDTPALRASLVRSGLDLLPADPAHPGEVRLVLLPGEEGALRNLNLTWKVLEVGRPLTEVLAGPEAPDPGYYTPTEIQTQLTAWATQYPKIARFYDATAYTKTAKTHENRSLYAIKISDNVNLDEDEPNWLVVSQHHARELNAAVMAMEAIRNLLEGYAKDPAIKALVDANEIWFIPCVNPDGTNYVWTRDYMWRKNRRNNGGGYYGVDPNRNYPFRWGVCGASTNPRYSTYCGPSAGSEPCVKTVMALSKMRHVARVIDFHSSGREVLFTYSPCTQTIPTAVRSYLNMAIAGMMTAAGYRTRNPSASGEQPEWQVYDRGGLAFLVEVMTSFQPAYTSAVTEAQTRTWPLLKYFWGLKVPMTGHVRDLGGKPVAADIAVSGVNFSYGEKIRSGGDYGRYFIWLAAGNYTLTFSAPGYKPVTVKASLSTTATVNRDIVLEPVDALMTKSGTGQINTKAHLLLQAQHDAGLPYFIGAALGTQPGQPVGSRTFPLNGDALFTSSLLLPAVFQNMVGYLDTSGRGTMTFAIPAWPSMVGLELFFAGFTVDPTYPLYVKSISNAMGVKIQP